MDHCPDLIVGGFLCPCIQHFCDLLSPGHRASSMKAQSLKVLLKWHEGAVALGPAPAPATGRSCFGQ
eukprot:scaffold197912_cov18-Tisochrysis_lutea.AAC.1